MKDEDLDECPECGKNAVVVWVVGCQCKYCGATL